MRDNQPAITRISSAHELKYAGVIGAVGARGLGRALPAASELTHLMLPNQRIGPDGTAALCAGLAEHNSSLTYLDLRANGLMDAGAAVVADLLATDRKIKIVNLEANRIGDEGAKVSLESCRRVAWAKSIRRRAPPARPPSMPTRTW